MDPTNRTRLAAVVLALVLGGALEARAAPVYYGPTPYNSAADSPFDALSYSYFYLETFETGFNSPGVSASGGLLIGDDPFVDSVEGGAAGHSWYSNGLHSISFTFDADVLGGLPTDVGMVWTDVGWNAPTPFSGLVTFEAFGPGGILLGMLEHLFGDDMDTGQKDEDRFFGVFYKYGISAIRLSTDNGDWEVDHLQYGARRQASVPEPSTLILFLLGGAGMMRGRMRLG